MYLRLKEHLLKCTPIMYHFTIKTCKEFTVMSLLWAAQKTGSNLNF